MGSEEEIKALEEEIKKTPYNKATEFHIGKLKAKLARLKEETQAKAKSKSSGKGFGVKKSGDATAILVGFPSVGKSTLLNKLTNAESRVAAYDFTTLDVIPGMMEYNGAKIQFLDIPGLIEGFSSGKGMGKKVLSVVRNADLVLIILAGKDFLKQSDVIEKELYNAGFRLNQKKPDIKIIKKTTGGIFVNTTVNLTKITKKTIIEILKEFRIFNAEVLIRQDVSIDELVDSLVSSRVYVPSLGLLNKIDMMQLPKGLPREFLRISALKNIGLNGLKELIWTKLTLMRIYMKKIGKEPDKERPLIIKQDGEIKDVCEKVHKDFLKQFKYARVWGSSKFPGQKVGLDYKLKDKDIVEIHIK